MYLTECVVPAVPLSVYCDTNDKGELACGLTCSNTHSILSLKDSLNTGKTCLKTLLTINLLLVNIRLCILNELDVTVVRQFYAQ